MAHQYEDQNQIYYHDYFQFNGRSKVMESIWKEAFGDDYLAGLDQYGYLTKGDLEVIANRLAPKHGDSLLDMGCGKSGPSLKLAEKFGLKLTGIDVIPDAVRQANEFQSQFNLAFPAQFEVGHFYKIPLESQSMDAVVSIDALWAAPNKIQALMEIKRVMKPGAKFIFTQWDLLAVDPITVFEISGLKFVHREETPNWKDYQKKVYEGISNKKAELVAEMGESANMLLYEASASPEYLDLSIRRIYEMVLPV